MNAIGIEIVREGEGGYYSTAGTVHKMATARKRAAARVGALGTPVAGLRPRPARGKGFPSNLLLD